MFQGRYMSIPIGSDPREGGLSYFRQVSTYIHLPPFRANLAGVGCSQKLTYLLERKEEDLLAAGSVCTEKQATA